MKTLFKKIFGKKEVITTTLQNIIIVKNLRLEHIIQIIYPHQQCFIMILTKHLFIVGNLHGRYINIFLTID